MMGLLLNIMPLWGWMIVGVVVLTVVITWLIVSLIIPARKIRTGIELLSGQETNNRLRLTGYPTADRVARLFNTLIERLQEQTIRNREQDRLLSELMGVTPMGVVLMDFDGRITEANRAALRFLEVDSSQIIGRLMSEIPGELAERISLAPQGKSTVRLSETEIYLVRKLYLIDRGFSRPFILIDNMAEEVRKVEKEAYSKVIRVMAHEVNNTMGGLKSLMETLAEIHAKDSLVSEVIGSGMESCDRLGDFVNSYAEVVRVPAPEKISLELRGYLQHKLPFLQGVAMGNDVELSKLDDDEDTEDSTSLFIMADPMLLERVLVNIVKNAAEAMPGNNQGLIRISAGRRGKEIELVISNNGLPISKEAANNLFKPFYTTKPGARGTGLALISEILVRHGWRYSLSSECTSSYKPITSFRIRIPR